MLYLTLILIWKLAQIKKQDLLCKVHVSVGLNRWRIRDHQHTPATAEPEAADGGPDEAAVCPEGTVWSELRHPIPNSII